MDEMQMVGLGATLAVVLGGALYFAFKGQCKGPVTTTPHPSIPWARTPKARLCVVGSAMRAAPVPLYGSAAVE